MPLPLSAILILITDLGFELFMALSYAWDTSENKAGLMKLPPRKPVTPESMERMRRIKKEGVRSWATIIRDHFNDPIDEDTLVDTDTLMWAYVEAGSIQSIGCLVCFFFSLYYHCGVLPADAVKFGANWGVIGSGNVLLRNGGSLTVDQQNTCLAIGQSGYYLALMLQQSFNLFICKARLSLPFGKFMFENIYNFYGVFGGAAFCFLVVYVPPFNIAFGTDFHLTPIVWVIAIGFGFINFAYSIVRFLILRARNPIKYIKDVQGLDLHPTRFSTGR